MVAQFPSNALRHRLVQADCPGHGIAYAEDEWFQHRIFRGIGVAEFCGFPGGHGGWVFCMGRFRALCLYGRLVKGPVVLETGRSARWNVWSGLWWPSSDQSERPSAMPYVRRRISARPASSTEA